MRTEAARYAVAAMSVREPVTTWIISATGFLKQGKHSVGVQRQYTGSAGKVTNCQIGVSLSVVSRSQHVPIDVALYIPKPWCRGAVVRRRPAAQDGSRSTPSGIAKRVEAADVQDETRARTRSRRTCPRRRDSRRNCARRCCVRHLGRVPQCAGDLRPRLRSRHQWHVEGLAVGRCRPAPRGCGIRSRPRCRARLRCLPAAHVARRYTRQARLEVLLTSREGRA